MHLAVEEAVRAVALSTSMAADADSTITRPSITNSGDDDGDHVVRDGRRAALDVPQPRVAAPRGGRRRSRRASGRPGRLPVAPPPWRRSRPAGRRSATRRHRRGGARHRRSLPSRRGLAEPLAARGGGSRRRAPGSRLGVPVEAGAPGRQQHGVAGSGGAGRPASTASAIDAGRRRPVRRRRTRPRCRRRPAPMATTAADATGLGGHRRQVEALVAARRRSGRRGRRRGSPPTRRAASSPSSRCTTHPAGLADELESVRRAVERRPARRRPRRRRRDRSRAPAPRRPARS